MHAVRRQVDRPGMRRDVRRDRRRAARRRRVAVGVDDRNLVFVGTSDVAKNVPPMICEGPSTFGAGDGRRARSLR
jgi:hypothetical protein